MAERDDERRGAIRAIVVSGGVSSPRDLARRLAAAGLETDRTTLREDLRVLGVVRVAGPDGPVLAVPAPADGEGGIVGSLTNDPDWPLQVVVAAVVVAFLLVAVVAWALGPH